MVGFGISVAVLVEALIESKDFSSFWYGMCLRAVATVKGVASTVIRVSLGICVVLVGMGVNMWAAKITALEFISVPSSSKAALLWGCDGYICWPITVWNSRASHARIPSCQV